MDIKVRENRKGNWWVSATHNGTDKYFEDASMPYAKMQMKEWLLNRGCQEQDMNFLSPVRYEHSEPIGKPQIGYQKVRIDHNPQG